MLIPYGTDAPLYHLPIVTVVLIVVNTLALAGIETGLGGSLDDWALRYGQGYHPLQWLSMNFAHVGVMHLLGNMFFLWSFGLIVEGKLGWWKFLVLYLGIGILCGAVVQTLMLNDETHGGAVGASGVVFGVVAIAMIWAPRNDLSCLLLLKTVPSQIDVPVFTFGLIYFGWEVLSITLIEDLGGTATGHLAGGVLGMLAGLALLATKVVDCENWDVFNVWKGTQAGSIKRRMGLESRNEETTREQLQQRKEQKKNRLDAARVQIAEFLEQNNAIAAAMLYQKLAPEGLTADQPQLRAMIAGLHKAQRWHDLIPLLTDYVRDYPAECTPMRLLLAQVLIEHERRPAKGREVLEALAASRLTPQQEQLRDKLLARVAELEEDADLEIDD